MNPGTKIEIIDAETLSSTPIPKGRHVVEGLLPQGISLLCGPAKIGKSWMVLRLALQVAQGLPLWDMKTEKGDVLYLCLEDTYARMQDRLFQLSKEPPDNLRFAFFSHQIGVGLEQDIRDSLKTYPDTKLIIIDTLQKVRNSAGPVNAGMYARDYDDISALKAVADRHGIAILLVHHPRKMDDKSDPFNNISGTNGIAGAMDTNLMLRRDDRASNMASLIATGRDIEYQELRLRFDSGKWELEERKTAEQKRLERIPTFLFELVNFIQERGSWQGTATELMAALAEKEVSANAATKYIAHFYDEVLRPAHVIYRTKRTASERLILLTSDDSCDGHDGERSIETAPSQPSLPSQNN